MSKISVIIPVYNTEEFLKDCLDSVVEQTEKDIEIIIIDDALFLENIPEKFQPRTNVRRVNGKRLTNEEMIEYYKDLVNKYGEKGNLYGYFQKGIAIVTDDIVKSFETKSK